jgi:hypothetical protein
MSLPNLNGLQRMLSYKSHFQTALPRTSEKRWEVSEALRTLALQEEDKRLRPRCADLASIRRELGQITLALHELRCTRDPRLRSYVIKYSADQSRVPAGNSDGGQWTRGGAADFTAVGSDSGNEQNGSSQAGTDDHTYQSDVSEVQIAAAEGMRCEGFSTGCQSGGTYGSSGMYNINGRVLCIDCAVKFFTLQDEPNSERTRFLERFLIGR